jgi:hypothetical protein
MATHHNQEQSGFHCRPFYFVRADRGTLFCDDSGDKYGPPYGFPMRDPSFHGDEKETHLPLKPKTGAPVGHKIGL